MRITNSLSRVSQIGWTGRNRAIFFELIVLYVDKLSISYRFEDGYTKLSLVNVSSILPVSCILFTRFIFLFRSQSLEAASYELVLPSPITAPLNHEVFTFDIPYPSSAPTQFQDHQPPTDTKRPRAQAVERLLSKFPKLRQMLEDEEAISNYNSTGHHFEPNYCSTPTFYSGLHLPPTTSSTSTIASSFVDEEYDVGYSSYNETIAGETCSYHDDLDNVFVDLDLTGIEKQILQALKPERGTSTNGVDMPSKQKSKHQCTLCPASFANRKDLSIHLRTHKGERPHKCAYCGKGFTQKSALRTHIRTHTGEKPYKCSTCLKAFSDISTYTKHNRTHTGERPYTCDLCGKGFAQSGNMIRHRQGHRK